MTKHALGGAAPSAPPSAGEVRLLVAQKLAARGLRVFPLRPGEKLPLLKDWPEKATTDQAQIAKWWADGHANIGVATGHQLPGGGYLMVVETDQKHGRDGDKNLRALAPEGVAGELDATFRTRSPTGSIHYYFKSPEVVRNSASKLAPDVDVRGWHGQVVAPSSKTSRGLYTFIGPAPIADIQPAPAWLLDAITAAYVQSEKVEIAAVDLDTEAAIAQATAYLADAPPAIEGRGGNDLTYRTACRLKDFGVSEFMAGVLMGGDWNARCAPPWDEDELGRIIANAYQYGENSAGSASVEHFFEELPDEPEAAANDNKPDVRKILAAATLDLAALADKPVPPRRWLVEDLIPEANVTLLYGDGGVGKSGLSLQLAAAVVTSTDWIGRPVAAGRALFLTAEDDQHELHRRLAEIAATGDVSLRDLANLKAISLADAAIDTALVLPDRTSGLLRMTKLWNALVDEVAKFGPKLIVLDTLTDFFGGDENVRLQARGFITKLRALALKHDTAILVLAHPSRAGLMASAAKQSTSAAGSSGSTGWNNSVRSRLYLSRGDGGEKRDPDLRVLEVMKANYARAGEQIRLRWFNGLLLPETAITGESAADRAAEAESVFLDMLDAYTKQGRRVSSSSGKNYAPALFADDERSGMLRNGDLAGAMNRLFDRGEIKTEVEGPPSRRRERIVRVDEAAVEGAGDAG